MDKTQNLAPGPKYPEKSTINFYTLEEKRGRRNGSESWTRQEIICLLELLEKYKTDLNLTKKFKYGNKNRFRTKMIVLVKLFLGVMV